MKNYTTIPNSFATKLNSADMYRYTALSFTPRKDGYTDSTFKQIGEYINAEIPESEETVKDFTRRLKDSKLITIEEVFENGKKRNHYYIAEPKVNYRIIKSELLKVKLPVELKGFMIQLSTITYNNTLEVNLNISQIVKLIKISNKTAGRYIKELLEAKFLIKSDSGYILSDKYFDTGKSPKTKAIEKILKESRGCEYLEDRYNKTNWKSIINPETYWTAVVCGFVGKKQYKAEIINEITL